MRARVCCVDLACIVFILLQEAWIQHATVRENIIFGKPFEAEKYREIIHGCALEQVMHLQTDYTSCNHDVMFYY